MLQFLLPYSWKYNNNWIKDCWANTIKYKILLFSVFPTSLAVTKESWLVFIFTLRWLICLNLARILVWADDNNNKN
jgi:hypothetical protein